MSSLPPKSEGRRRPVSMLAIKLWEIAEAKDERLDNPGEVLDILVTAVAKGEQPIEAWQSLHAAAAKHDRVGDLALAYEHTISEKRIKLLQPEQQAFVYLRAAEFFAETLADTEGAIGFAERAALAVPGHAEAFALLERALSVAQQPAKLAELYVDASAREADPGRRSELMQRAAELVKESLVEDDRSVDVGQRILRLEPGREDVRAVVVQRLIARGRHKDVIELLELALRREPPPSAEEATLLREWLVDLCLSELKDPARALGHIEGLLITQPDHAIALKWAETLLENRSVSLRAAAALSDAYEKTGRMDRAIAMLGVELKQVRGPRRMEVQRRLGVLRQDVLNDPAGALELLAPVVAGEPGNDDLRRRFVSLSLSLNQPEQAARLLGRALTTSRDPAVRARVGVDVGQVYLKIGDVKRAQGAFQQALESGHDQQALLEAAKQLSDLYAESGERKQLTSVLEIVVKLEPEREPRQAAARRLARLCDAEGGDPARAIVAWSALVGSPWSDEALRRLETLYGEAGDDEGLSEVMFHRAERSKDPEEARRLSYQAAELRAARTRDPESALAGWQRIVVRYGPSREVHQRMVPLLEQAQRYAELAQVLVGEASLLEGREKIQVLLSLGQLRQLHLGDAQGALDAFAEALAIDGEDRNVRAAIEKLLVAGPARLAAASVLEPVFRREEGGTGLLRILDVRGELGEGTDERLAALDEARALSEAALSDADRALAIAGRALTLAVRERPEQVPERLAQIQRLASASGNPARRAEILCDALGSSVIDSPALLELAKLAGDALAAAGEVGRAIEVFRAALSYDSSSRELIQRVDDLLTQQGAPEERLHLYLSALQNEPEPARRRELLHALATLQRRELRDPAAALETWRVATDEDPRDLVAHQALVDALLEMGDYAAAHGELERVLPYVDGERRNLTLLKLAEIATLQGDKARSLRHYCGLLEGSDLSDDVLETIEQLARELGDGHTVRAVLERRLAHPIDANRRAGLLERLGNAHAWLLEDAVNAARWWLEGARLSETVPDGGERARRLYARVLDVDADNREAAERLVELGALAGDFETVRSAFEVLSRAADERELVLLLLGLEEQAVASGHVASFVALIDLALARAMQPARAHLAQLAKARALSTQPASADAAAALFRVLLEAAGDDVSPDVEAFEAFLSRAERTPARIADHRWLFAFRLARSGDPATVLLQWAAAEESLFDDLGAALELYRSALERDPDRVEALSELARLQTLAGDPRAAYATLENLAARSEPEARASVDVRRALLLSGPLHRPKAALELVQPMLRVNPSDPEALRVVHHALAVPEARAQAAAILESIAESSTDPAARADVIEALLAVSDDAPELTAARSRWLMQLLETKSGAPEQALQLALRGAEAAPGEEELWNFAEQMARKLDQPAPVAEAYARAIERDLTPNVADALGRRMVEFHEEWFDDAERVVRLLERVLALCPDAEWAFDRLKLSFNSAGRWSDLFALYDQRLQGKLSASERVELLREAAMAARDFAGDPARAIGYFERLNEASPGDNRVESSLERLYERHGHKRPLIALLSARRAAGKVGDPSELAGRIAALWLDLNEPLPALALAEGMLASDRDPRDAVSLLERIVAMPSSTSAFTADGATARERAALALERHYRQSESMLDVVRMLEIRAEGADSAERVELLEEVVALRLDTLADPSGAFETLLAVVELEPSAPRRKRFAQLAATVARQERRAEALVQIAAGDVSLGLRATLLAEAADVYAGELADLERAKALYRQVLALSAEEQQVALHAARELSRLLRDAAEHEELVSVLEQRAALERDAGARREAWAEAAELSLAVLANPERAVRAWRARLSLDERDALAVDGLCRALESGQRWDELLGALEQRARLSKDERAARADRVRIAEIHGQIKHDPSQAIAAWLAVVEHHGRSLDSYQALAGLFAAENRSRELAELIAEEVAHETDPARRSLLFRELGTVHQSRTGDALAALEAFVSAGDWEKAIQVAGANHTDAEVGRQVCARLLDRAVEVWLASGGDSTGAAARAADWAVGELSARLLEAGKYADVVARQLAAAKLPMPVQRSRELRRDAACLCSDRLGDEPRAIALFQALLAEDPADDVARSCVTRLALLLEEQGAHAEVVTLWETQARARADAGDGAGAAALWARAGELAEQRLADVARAIRSYTNGAALGGEASLEALARLYAGSGEHEQAARALETLCAQSSPEVLAERAMRLADQYQAFGANEQARASLERAAKTALDAAALRARLAELYRAERDYTALAGLLAEEAERSVDRKATLAILREAFELHLVERKDPVAAIPLIERAVELEPEDHRQRLRLAQALHQAKRYDDAAAALRAQIERYGSRRPKDRALAHFELAKVLLAAEREREALGELDAASKIDPAHPGIMQMLARVALEHGELDRAEKMYRSLLLVLGREGDGDGPSKAEALIALSEIATRRGDAVRAGEFIESAFESALESPRDALALESALRAQGRHELLARALESRLTRKLAPAEAAAALADLVAVHAQGLGDLERERPALERRAEELEASLSAQPTTDDLAWAALSRVYDELGDSSREAAILERRLAAMPQRSSRPPADPDLFYRLSKVRLAEGATFEQGLDLLERALSLAPDYARARSLLAAPHPGSEERIAELLERIARATGDERALADALAAQLSRPDTDTARVREGVELALRLDDGALALRMLQLGLSLNVGADSDKAWIRLELARLAEGTGDHDVAQTFREQAADFLPANEARALRLSLAQTFAAAPDQRVRAVKLLERVLSDDPLDRSVWQPLLDLLRELGDRKRLEKLLAAVTPQIDDLGERSTLRIERVNTLLGMAAREAEVIALLQEIVADDPGQHDAARVLAELLEREGRLDDLAELLQGEIDRAKDERNLPEISALSLRLAGLREKQDRLADALDVCRAALEWEPSDRRLLEGVLRLSESAGDPVAQCEALEGLLRVEQGESAARLARRLSTLREELGDPDGAERALVLGFEANPADASLRDLLVVRFAERDDHARVAEVLMHALRGQPHDKKLLGRLVEAQRAAGNSEAALTVLDTLIAQEPNGVTLYRNRAALLAELGRDLDAVETLERALEHDPSVAGELIEALERAIARAEGEQEVALTLRLVEIFEASGDVAGARARLAAFVREAPPSLEALRRLATLEAKTGNTAGAIETLQEIARGEQGQGLIETALRLYETCELAGRAGDAREALERAFHTDRRNPDVRVKLFALYEASGENGRLSELLLEQAMSTPDPGERLELLLRAGGLLLGEGDAEAAVGILEQARQDNPENLQAIVLLARAYSRAQRAEDGLNLLNAIADANRGRRGKGLGPVYAAMADIHLDEGFLTDALQALTKAFELDPKNGELAMRLGQLAIEIDEDEVAQRAFRAVAIMKPPAPGSTEGAHPDAKADANYYLALLARKQGDPRKAKVLASKALSEKPGHEAARQLLAELANA